MLSNQEKIVLSYQKLKDRIRSESDQKKVLKNLAEIRAEYSETYIKSFSTLLDKTLPKLYDGLHFDTSALDFKKLTEEKCVVLVPNHQSHADYVAINYLVFKKFGIPLYVAGGNNLNIFPIGKLFRKSGCFFIRRSFANDILYKLTLEAYLYYLLKEGRPIEFFFEGGRSRTGRLLSPRYGLYQMLLETYSQLKSEGFEKELVFLPVSVAHEYVPEQKSLVQELKGAKKKKESTGQLFGLVKLFSYQFGNVNIKCGTPIAADPSITEPKRKVQSLAFDCFREVGKNMMVTPTSLLAMVLLDEPAGALRWEDILSKGRGIRDYCENFDIPITESLEGENIVQTLERAIDILIGNKKVDVIGKGSQGHTFYSINGESRPELLYFKNTILHHFLVPGIMNTAWINLFKGRISTVDDLKRLFLEQRDMLKHEFYLPTVKDMFQQAAKIISKCIGREITTVDELMDFSHKELYQIASKINYFARAFSFIIETYFVTAVALRDLFAENPKGFKMDAVIKKAEVVFENEKALGRTIKYPESFSVATIRSSVKYFSHSGHIENFEGLFRISDMEGFEQEVKRYGRILNDNFSFDFHED